MRNKIDREKRLNMSISEQRKEFLALLILYGTTKMSYDGLKKAKELGCLERYRKIIKQNQQNDAYNRMFGNTFTAQSEEDLERKQIIKNENGGSENEKNGQNGEEPKLNNENLAGENEEGENEKGKDKNRSPRRNLRRPDDYIAQIVGAYYDLLQNMKNNLEVNILTKAEAELCFEQAVEKFLREHKNHPSNKKVVDEARDIIFGK